MLNHYWIEEKNTNDNNTYGLHMHNEYEINLILTDGVELFVDNMLYTSKRGDVFLFPPFCYHKTNINLIHYNRYLMYFDSFAILDFSTTLIPLLNIIKNSNTKLIHLNEKDTKELIKLLKIANEVRKQHNVYSDFNNLCAFGNIITFLVKRINIDNCISPSVQINNSLIENIIIYISQHIDEDLSVEKICKMFNVSKSTLWHLLKKKLGLSLNEYITNLRISRAMELLIQNTSLTDTMYACGFNSYAHFIRTFTKITGVSPYKYSKTFQTSTEIKTKNTSITETTSNS